MKSSNRRLPARGGRTTPRPALRARQGFPRLTLDQAFIGLLIGAMEANQHMSREEAARAHHIIWSMKRFRSKSGDSVGRLIEGMRTLIEEHGAVPVMSAAARVIPARLRPAAYAVSADLILADGRIDKAERRFLDRLGRDLGLERETLGGLQKAILVKNSA